jgi:hypothetical protein
MSLPHQLALDTTATPLTFTSSVSKVITIYTCLQLVCETSWGDDNIHFLAAMDPEADPEEIGSLKNHAQGVVEYFTHLSQHEETGDNLFAGYDAFWASRQSAEFNLWCAKVGIFTEG